MGVSPVTRLLLKIPKSFENSTSMCVLGEGEWWGTKDYRIPSLRKTSKDESQSQKPAIFQRVRHFVGKQWPLLRILNASASQYPQGLANLAHSRRFMSQLLPRLVNSKDHIAEKLDA